jgi:hypothetical protein
MTRTPLALEIDWAKIREMVNISLVPSNNEQGFFSATLSGFSGSHELGRGLFPGQVRMQFPKCACDHAGSRMKA